MHDDPPIPMYERAAWEEGIDLFFETLFLKAEKGEVTYKQLEAFFPKDVRDRAREPSSD